MKEQLRTLADSVQQVTDLMADGKYIPAYKQLGAIKGALTSMARGFDAFENAAGMDMDYLEGLQAELNRVGTVN